MTDTDRAYFLSMYGRDPDPWGFDSRWYEQRKFALTLAALPDERYERGIEAGCSNGALTELLAARCDELFAFDFVDDAVQRTTTRMNDRSHVHVVTGRFPEYWPHGGGDLVVWSEIAYYLSIPSGEHALRGLQRWLKPGGILVAVHYTGATNYPRRGADIIPWLDDSGFLSRVSTLYDESFELGVWRRHADGES